MVAARTGNLSRGDDMSTLLDCLYLVAGACLLPYWLWKLPQAPRYRAGIFQRLGFSPRLAPGRKRLWLHCASVGEAAVPRKLVAEFRERHADWQVVFSAVTDTGAARLRELYPDSPVFYMPLDFSPCTRMALRRVRPDAVILVELEYWPNFAMACRSLGVPLAIINGRIGPSSRRMLGLLRKLWPSLWRPVAVCCARSHDDAAGFVEAGLPADKVLNCGLLKCDGLAARADPEHERKLRKLFAIAAGAPVLVAGSTHEGEETVVAAAYRDLKISHRALRLIIAPRHVERAGEVTAALRARGHMAVTKSALEAGQTASAGDAVIVVDTIGDLVGCYGLATCAFVGRSLSAPGGGQNVMEPAALGKPVLTGPYTSNFGPEMGLLKSTGAAVVVHNGPELIREVGRLLSAPAQAMRMGEAGRRIVRESQGATSRTLDRLAPILRHMPDAPL